MGRIHVLPDLLVNKIAAGEVVERPASVVKELMENAIDAGATRIEVAIEQGGRKLIRVNDDGKGMDADDVQLTIVSHATSKVSHEDDLFAISTLGFRGEALASIASVSHLSIVSRRHEDVEGHTLQVAGGKVEPVRTTGCAPGTDVQVRDLFFNMPARQKFLRTVNTEMGHIVEQFARIAIAHPELNLTLTHNGRELHRLSATDDLHGRISNFYGSELVDLLIPVKRDERGIRIQGHVILPSSGRATTKWQYLFLNGRFIRDRFAGHAVKEAYRGLMDSHRQPAYFLFLTVDPASVDVNVHPTKTEVRWRDSGMIHSQVLSSLRETFSQHDLTPSAAVSQNDEQAEQRRDEVRKAMADYFKSIPPTQPVGDHRPTGSRLGRDRAKQGAFSPDHGWAPAPAGGSTGFRSSFDRSDDVTLLDSMDSVAERDATVPSCHVEEVANAGCDEQASIGTSAIQLHNAYLVAETEDGIIIVDQHALHERVMYETFTRRLSQGPLESQRMLLPVSVLATAEQMAAVETHAELLADLGLELTPFGKTALAVQAFPVLLDKVDLAGFVRDLLEKLTEIEVSPSRETLVHEVVDMMACKAAVKAGDPLNASEIEALLASRERVERASNCPHGRPTTIRMSFKELEKQFQRT
jgi:DNA mismatch repair protein MutL